MNEEQGRVKWFNDKKGYGFIAREHGPDIFVHYRCIVGAGHRTLQEGASVSFTLSHGPKGLQADAVRIINEVPAPS